MKGGREERVEGAGRVVKRKFLAALVDPIASDWFCDFLACWIEDGSRSRKKRSGDRCCLYTLVAGKSSGLPLHCHGRLDVNGAGDGFEGVASHDSRHHALLLSQHLHASSPPSPTRQHMDDHYYSEPEI